VVSQQRQWPGFGNRTRSQGAKTYGPKIEHGECWLALDSGILCRSASFVDFCAYWVRRDRDLSCTRIRVAKWLEELGRLNGLR